MKLVLQKKQLIQQLLLGTIDSFDRGPVVPNDFDAANCIFICFPTLKFTPKTSNENLEISAQQDSKIL